MLTVILTILLFMILVIPHEFGHFITAKLCGVQVNEFSVGMGPSLFHKQKGETQYSVRLIPLGGYCAMEGENEETDNPRAFTNKKGWQKLIILFAGAAMNIIVANLVMIIAFTVAGNVVNKLAEVTPGGPADQAGIRAGDVIVAVQDVEVDTWGETVTEIAKGTVGEPMDITVRRGGERVTCTVVPEYSEDGRLIVGITASVSHNPFTCGASGIQATWDMFKYEIEGFKMLFSGKLGREDVAGPVGMVQLVKETTTTSDGGFSFLFLIALISLNLAIINLLPLPSLDGGRILFVIIRKITGNMISVELEAKVHLIGIILLLMLFVYITWGDIMRLLGR